MSNLRKVTFPPSEKVAVVPDPKVPPAWFGAPEYLIQNVCTAPQAFEDKDAAELVAFLDPKVRPLLGEAGSKSWTLTLTKGEWETLCRLAKPRESVNWLLTRNVAAILIALYAAEQVDDKA